MLIIHIRRSCLAVLVMSSICGILCGQSHDYLFHPSFFDQYLTMQALPGGDVRVFAVSDQTNGWPNPRVVFIDFSAEGLQSDQQPTIISSPGQSINNIVFDPLTLRCNDGSTIIANNFFDCDYWGSDAIYKQYWRRGRLGSEFLGLHIYFRITTYCIRWFKYHFGQIL